MQLDKYKGVIKRVYEKNPGASFEDLYSRLIDSLEIAADLLGDKSVLIETPDLSLGRIHSDSVQAAKLADNRRPVTSISGASISSAPADPFKGAILISSAPPVAGADQGDDAPEDDVDYYESKPGKGDGAERLQQKLLGIMPRTIEVKLPNFDEPMTLVCGIGSSGLKFCHVNYTLQGSHEMGPRVTIMTSQKEIDKESILKDIIAQAASMYSKERRVLQPKVTPPQPPPSSQDLQNMLNRDRQNQAPISQEDAKLAKEWESSRSPQWL